MSTKTQAIATLVVTILAGLTPVAADFAGAGFPVVAKAILEIVAIAGIIKASALPALFGAHASPSALAPKPKPPTLIGGACLALALLALGCTSQQAATAVTIEQAACLAEETVASVIPPGAVQTAANDIALVCTSVPVASIVAFVEQFLANQADAGVPAASGTYVPSPHVAAAKAAK